MVSAGHHLAAAAGFRIFEEGGNAVDAGVASGIALNVVRPTSTNFGGVAPIIIYLAASDSVVTISGLGRWPRAASIEYFNRNAGGEIPHGHPEDGGAVGRRRLAHGAGEVRHHELGAGRRAGAGDGRTGPPDRGVRPARPAEVFRRRVANKDGGAAGAEGPGAHVQTPHQTSRRPTAPGGARRPSGPRATYFYKGDIAEEMARFSRDQGGLLTLDDLKDFSVQVEEPEVGRFRDYSVYTCGAWCQGPVLAETLQMLEDDDLAGLGHNSADYIHLLSQALNLAFADREHYYGDPDHVDVPIDGLLSKRYTTARRGDIDMERAFPEMPPPGNPWPYQGDARSGAAARRPEVRAAGAREQDTSYTCTVDRWGNAFSATPSDGVGGCKSSPAWGSRCRPGERRAGWSTTTHPACSRGSAHG